MNTRTITCSCLALALLFTGCASQATPNVGPRTSNDSLEQLLIDRGITGASSESIPNSILTTLYQHYDEWQGVRYRFGGMSKDGTDCSGFAKVTFSTLFNINLPRSTTDQANFGYEIDQDELKPGDLVFFQIHRNLQHVGIYLENRKFLHASTSAGVVVSRLDEAYWRKRYWKSVRIDEVAQSVPEQVSLRRPNNIFLDPNQ